jgi:hypothetical protein
MSNTVYYKKVGRRYVPVAEYDGDLLSSLPYGAHLVLVQQGMRSTIHNIEPAHAPVIAVMKILRDRLVQEAVKASEIRTDKKLTPEQQAAFDEFKRRIGEERFYFTYGSIAEMINHGTRFLEEEARKLLENHTVRECWEQYRIAAELVAKHESQ